MDRLRPPSTSEPTNREPEPKGQRRVPPAQEPFALVRVEETDSNEWGNPSLAAARASLETTVNPMTERLIRTFHPSLGPCPVVYVMESDKDPIWVVIPGNFVIPTTHAAGREIHVMPGSIIQDRIMKPPFHDDPLSLVLNPRRLLSQDNLDMLRALFPTAIGVRTFISGFIVVLFGSRYEIERSWFRDGFFTTFGSLRLFYDVLEVWPSMLAVNRSARINRSPNSQTSSASLGLKLRFPDGNEAITVPTHAFVQLKNAPSGPLLRAADWFAKAKSALSRFVPPKRTSHHPGIITLGEQVAENSPLGKSVYLAMEQRKLGVITSTYDQETSDSMKFPTSFHHDLSLMTSEEGSKLPSIISPDGTPQVVGWGDDEIALNGGRLFALTFNIATGNLIHRAGRDVSPVASTAIAEGCQYIWDGEAASQSLLWRTENDRDSPEGFSGSALCLGDLSHKTCLAICFQNFEFPLLSGDILKQDHSGPTNERDLTIRIKGGFLLPEGIREADIICDNP
ncbi:hypothetical protein F4861DRAFT_88863 [Xylaria intraflava]|nr:hypothetical protein F4861DRAFT_88863 [Xylaria intraflava]